MNSTHRMLALAAALVLSNAAQAQQCSGGPDGGMDATGNQCNTLLVLATAAFGSTAEVSRERGSTAAVHDAFKPASGESLAMIVPAKGVQIYKCRAGKNGSHEWVFVAPDAELFDTRGNPIGRHGAGPHWQASDGSRIAGTLKTRVDAPVAGAIPWLLLAAKATGPEGSFTKVTSIQRVNTVGGKAPTTPCNQQTDGTSARVYYTADYYFFTPN